VAACSDKVYVYQIKAHLWRSDIMRRSWDNTGILHDHIKGTHSHR